MENFNWGCPTRYSFGRGVVAGIGAEAERLGAKSALIVYGKGSAVRSGLVDAVKASLAEREISALDIAGIRPNPEIHQVRAGVAVAKAAKVDVVIAVGGGSVIDAAKAIAFGALYEGDTWDFFAKTATIKACLPVLCVLTIPAAGSENSSSCVISNDELGLKRGVSSELFRPVMAFMDPEVTFTLPAYQTAAGATDMIAHICERWFSGVDAVPVTDRTAAGLIRTIMEAAPACLEDPEDYEARANLMWAGALAHNGICGVGRALNPNARAGGWESHALEHELSALKPDITHGAGLAVIMPAWMRYVWREDPMRFLDFALEVFDIEPVDETAEAVEDAVTATIDELQAFFESIGMPKTLGEFGLTEDDIPALLEHLEQNKGAEFGAFKRLTMEDAAAIYRSAF